MRHVYRRKVWYKNKKIATMAAIVLILLVFLGLRNALGGEAEGTVSKNIINSAAENKAPIPIKIVGNYLNFTYPGNYRRLPVQKPAGIILENYDLNSGGFPSSDLAVAITSLPSGKLEDSPSYQLRELKPAQYKKELWQTKGSSYPVYNDINEGYSKVAYIVKGDKVLSVALSGGNDVNKLTEQQKAVIESVEWKN